MRILLIYPQYSHSSEFDSRAPSMSLFYIASMLERHGHEVVIYDASLGPIVKTGQVFRYGDSDSHVYDFLSASKFDVVGITCSFNARWKFVSRLAQQVKQLFADVPVVVGGLFPTYEWEYCLNSCSSVDFVMLGEAELSFVDVVSNLARGYDINDSCKSIGGVAWKVKDQLFCNPKVEFNNNLDDLPLPAWHLADLNQYFQLQKNIFELPAPCLPILSSRGCPNRCSFCNMYITHGRHWRFRSAENVLDEIEYLKTKFGVRNFYFIDDNFSANLKRAKRICGGILERQLKIKYNFHNGLSVNAIDNELVRLMKKSGCTSVCLAVESGSERIRNGVYKKNLKTGKIVEVFNWYRKAKIPTIGYFMVGAPGETKEDFEQSRNLMAKVPMSLATVGIYTPYPGTQLYDECKEKGWLIEPSIEDDSRVEMFSSMLRTPDFEPEDVARWQKQLYISFIRYHWFDLIKEALRPMGVVNRDMIGKFLGMLKFRRTTRN
jgi:anaerobic magnesium-protoporphyrin IX monomethyl ester cyclase